MVHRLQFGQHKTIQLQQPPHTNVDHRRYPSSPLSNPVEAVAQALQSPLGFPSLHLAATPGDHVVIALDDDIPDPTPIVAGILEVLECGGVDPEMVLVLRGCPEMPSTTGKDREAEVERVRFPAGRTDERGGGVSSAIQVEQHDPRDRGQLAYLAANRDGNPIYLNRHLVDADLVVPVSPMRLSDSPGYFGVFGGLLPKFSDEETLLRFQHPTHDSFEPSSDQLAQQCDEAAWLLGTMLAVQVISHSDGTLQGVLAGVPESLANKSQRKLLENWSYTPPFRASLVVATLAGGETQQTWANLSRAVHAAGQVVDPGGVIVLCTDLQSVPSPLPFSPLSRQTSRPTSRHASRQVSPGDNPGRQRESRDVDQEPPELNWGNAMRHWLPEETRLYLLSGLHPDVVEELGWGCLQHPDELQRLADQHRSWILLDDAQHLRIAGQEEGPTR